MRTPPTPGWPKELERDNATKHRSQNILEDLER